MPDDTATGLSNPLFLITFLGVFVFAVMIDVLDMIMEFIGVGYVNPGFGQTVKTVFSKTFLTIMDFGATFIIGGWNYWAQKQGVSTKGMVGQKRTVPAKATTEASKEATKAGVQEAGKETAKAGAKEAGKTGAKTAAKAGGKAGLRAGLSTGLGLLGELIPFVGAAPCWTLTVGWTFINVIRGK